MARTESPTASKHTGPGHPPAALLCGLASVTWSAFVHDSVAQTVHAQEVRIGPEGYRLLPNVMRYAFPSELDLMAQLAGLRLERRTANWNDSPFTTTSTHHVSLYSHQPADRDAPSPAGDTPMTIPPQILTDAFGPNRPDARVSLVADRRGTALWRVRHENGDQHALKITTACSDPQGHVDSERLALVEAQLLQALERDGVVTGFYHQHGQLPDNDGSWLALRWLPGEEADTAFAKLRHTPSDRTAARYAAAMAGAVADLHDNGWRHGDMQEVHFLLHDDRAHLLDFAMAQPPAPAGPAPVTYRGAYDYFNSPELAARRLATRPTEHLELTTASEVWSLCATIYACWTGTYPISEKNTQLSTPALRAELAQGHYRDLTTTRPWAFPAFENTITAGLTKDPTQRPTARQLHHQFQKMS